MLLRSFSVLAGATIRIGGGGALTVGALRLGWAFGIKIVPVIGVGEEHIVCATLADAKLPGGTIRKGKCSYV